MHAAPESHILLKRPRLPVDAALHEHESADEGSHAKGANKNNIGLKW